MQFESLSKKSSFRPWSKWEEGDYIVGEYTKVSVDRFGKNNYQLKVIEAKFNDGTAPKSGDYFTLNSNGALEYNMKELSYGDVFKVEYQGKSKIDNKKSKFHGKEYHKIDIQVAVNDSESSDLLA